MTRQWLLKPSDVAVEGKIRDYYESVQEQTTKLLQMLNKDVSPESSVYKEVANIRNNIEFMNQMNHVMTYVQLPLKMTGQNAHGDLYVYTNKKNLARQDGTVSAFLHLDMDNLGPVDVYVAMQNQNVKTKFYLADESVIDLIEQHMEELNERLRSKGYQLQSDVVMKDASKEIMNDMFQNNKEKPVKISHTSFDMRA